ncbi:MAG: hypothetical protein IJW59_01450 [Clostridia bacterium]|nr:hypothetical protein [Clostridia bacterium]
MKNKWKLLVLVFLAVAFAILPNIKMYALALETQPNVIATGEQEGSEGSGLEGENSGEGTGAGDDPALDEELGDETEQPSDLFEGRIVATTEIADTVLYKTLLNIYQKKYKGTDREYTGTSIYTDMFKNETELILDSSVVKEGAIKSIAGLELLEFDSLETFSINGQQIGTFYPISLRNTKSGTFKTLRLSNTGLTSIDLTGLTTIYNIDLSQNSLKTVDFSNVEGVNGGGTILNYNLAGNQFKSMDDIVLPSKRIAHINLNLLANNIIDIDESYFSEYYTLQIGVQGFISDDKVVSVDTKRNFVYYKSGIEGLTIDIVRIDGDFDQPVTSISDADVVEGNSKTLSLPVGEYRYDYLINGTNAYDFIGYEHLESCEFFVIPQRASYIFEFKGKEYTELGKVTGIVTVKLSSSEGAKIFYQVNNGEWTEGDVVVCDKGGNYNINVKTVIDGYESEYQSIWVRTSLNLYVPDVFMLVIVLLITLTLFLVVLPIVSKKYFKHD